MKKSHTRKQRALRRLALAVLLLAALNMTGAVNFLPRQAMREQVEKWNLTEARVIKYCYNNAMPARRYARQYLVAGQEGIALFSVGAEPLRGWWVTAGQAVPLRDGEPLTLAYSCQAQGVAYAAQVFGRVDDERIVRIVLRWRPGTGIEDDFRYWELPQEAFFRVDGKRYVLCGAQEVGVNDELLASEKEDKWFGFFISDLTALAYDGTGTLIATVSGVPDYTSWHSGK